LVSCLTSLHITLRKFRSIILSGRAVFLCSPFSKQSPLLIASMLCFRFIGKCGEEGTLVDLKILSQHSHKYLRGIMKTLKLDSWFPSREMNRIFLEYKLRGLMVGIFTNLHRRFALVSKQATGLTSEESEFEFWQVQEIPFSLTAPIPARRRPSRLSNGFRLFPQG
jgi:hypothetical protein